MPKRVDDNQPEIVHGLRLAGYSVADTHVVGDGFPDIVVGGPDHHKAGYLSIWLMEIKNKDGKVTRREHEWHEAWRGPKVPIVRTIDDALRVVGAIE
jgi:hypothetical protein